MAATPPKLIRFDGGASDDGSAVVISGKLDDGKEVEFAIDYERVNWVFWKMVDWHRDAAKKAGWKATAIAGKDDSGVWLRPTQFGLVDVGKPDEVSLVVDIGPTRLRMSLTREGAVAMGQALSAAGAPKTRPN